jgi:enoyl-[acyl-carrier protein] reductase I
MDPFSLKGKRGLVVGIANDRSIAYGCAKRFVAQGAELAITYLNEKAEPYVRPLAEKLKAPVIAQCDVSVPGELEAVFDTIRTDWGRLDFLVHSIAYARKEDFNGRVIDCSEEGFAQAMSISCHSFLRMARLAEPLMKDGGSLLTLTFYASEKAMPGYGLMGPVKAALESSVKYMAAELGPVGIRVNALSSGPIQTRAASGIPGFDELMSRIVDRTATGKPVTIDEVGNAAAFLVSDAASSTTGTIQFVDGGFHNFG